MYADPDAIRTLASSVRARADEIRGEADRLVRLLDTTCWTGRAADAARGTSRRRAGDLVAGAALHEEAALALERHAREVEERLDLLRRAERAAEDLVDRGIHLAGHLAGDLAGDLVPTRWAA